MAMTPRLKKLFGTITMIGFVVFYAMAISAFAPRILSGASKLTELGFYLIAGLAWTLPLLPLIRWMERKPEGNP